MARPKLDVPPGAPAPERDLQKPSSEISRSPAAAVATTGGSVSRRRYCSGASPPLCQVPQLLFRGFLEFVAHHLGADSNPQGAARRTDAVRAVSEPPFRGRNVFTGPRDRATVGRAGGGERQSTRLPEAGRALRPTTPLALRAPSLAPGAGRPATPRSARRGAGPRGGSGGPILGQPPSSMRTSSTRRFSARPSAVSLERTGWVGPSPMVFRRSAEMP